MSAMQDILRLQNNSMTNYAYLIRNLCHLRQEPLSACCEVYSTATVSVKTHGTEK